MKKTFYQWGYKAILTYVLYLLVELWIGAVILLPILSGRFLEFEFWLLIPIMIWGFVYMFLNAVSSFYNRVIFYDDCLLATGNLLKNERVQYKSKISYSDICDIQLVLSVRNSQKQSMKLVGGHGAPTNTFFELTLNNGKKKWVYVSGFSKKQRQSILKLLNEKTGLNISYEELLANKYYYTYKKAKKD